MTLCSYGVTWEQQHSFPKHCLNTCIYIYVPVIHVDKHTNTSNPALL